MGTNYYKIFFLCAVFLWVANTSLFAQGFSLDVHNEPLNKVLVRLGLEISFDDRALSEYIVSASKSFDNPEKALTWLLEDKPLRIERKGRVYILVPLDNPPTAIPNTPTQQPVNERFIFSGMVVSMPDDAPLEFATVCFLSQNDQLITTGITAGNGLFRIQIPRAPAQIKISYVGYETLSKTIDNLSGALGVFRLKETAIELNETVITADNNQQGINRSIYAVTPEMRYGADHALELLNKIPNASYDKSTLSARLNNHSNILLLVDGIQQSHSYLNHLSPGRVQAIEVVYALSGRFVSDDYAGIIHFILKKDYTGFDIHAAWSSSLNLTPSAPSNRLTESHPSAGFTLTTSKLNFFGMIEQNREDRSMLSSKYLSYSGTQLTSIPSGSQNNAFQNDNYIITGGMNYHFKPRQLIGIQADFSSGNTYTFQEHNLRRTDVSNDYDLILTNRTENRIKAHRFTGSLFYHGQVTNRLRLYGDFSYNYYFNDMENEYHQDEPAVYRYFDLWDEHKNQTVLNIEGSYKLSNILSLEAGLSNIWRSYASESSQGRGFLDYGEQRNKVFAYHTWQLSEFTALKAGLAVEHIRQRSREDVNVYFCVLPFLMINHKFNPSVSLSTGYATNQSYPSLNELSPISIVIDTFLTLVGNPVLKSSVRHQVFTELSLWNKLTIMPHFSYISNGVSEVYDQREYKLYRSFGNINYREYNLHTSYTFNLSPYLRFKNTVSLYRSEAIHNSLNGWTFQSEADYYHPRSSLSLQLGYYRNMKKHILWQGYQMADRDYWCLTARKEFLKNRFLATLSFIPPVGFGIRYDRLKEIDTPLYKEKTTMRLDSFKQMLLLKISYRFDRGSAKPVESRTDRKIIERE